MIVWVHLPELKIHFYHKEVLTTLGNLIGRTIKLDYHTLTQQRAKFARLAVEVDLSRPLVPRIWLDDDWQAVEYENLPAVCFECGKIGHSSTACPQLRPAPVPEVAGIAVGGTQISSPEISSEGNAGFGPWMLVTRKGRRNQRESNSKGKEKDSGNTIKAKEKDLGGLHHGNTDKNGKGALKFKDPEVSLPVVAPQPSALLQRSSAQERKELGGRNFGEGRRNGKEVMREEGPPVGKGLMGPGPAKGSLTKKGQPKSEASKASTSSPNQTPPILLSRPNEVSSSGPREQDSPKARPITPPPTLVSTGPNGTVLQVIQVASQGDVHQRRADLSPPSTAIRTKGRKSSKGQSKKGSPAKLNPIRPLQIWSPMKERKAKSKSRMASLTLQEINAWTEAALSATGFPAAKDQCDAPTPPSGHGVLMGGSPPASARSGGAV
ncbi:unnamed protein product [Linum trigynum]|uniref:CCHC-type domain-containing protein n=1 Tax=Linum trigynum TaxID=586398 RepID=A0AAV2GQQ3_9ROSI